MLVCSTYITLPKQFKPWKIPAVVGSIVVVGVLTSGALLQSKCDMKAIQMNVQCSLIREVKLYRCKLGHNTAKAIKDICCTKVERTVDHSTVTRLFKKFCSGYKKKKKRKKKSPIKKAQVGLRQWIQKPGFE